MLNKKLFYTSFVLGVCALTSANANLTLQDLTFPKPPAYRVGISSTPENQYIQAQEDINNIESITSKIDNSIDDDSVDVTYADLSIKRLSKEVAKELNYEEQDMVADLSLLWQGAATQSDTINFALYKLANPDADKPDKQSLKKVLSTIASMSTLVGASMASPVFAGSSLIGSNILGIMSQDTKSLNYKYTKVTDADMIILIRKVEDLQQNAVDLYYDYMSARKQVEMISKLVDERERKFKLAQSNNAARELIVITDAYYRSALDKQRSVRSNFLSKRAALEQFVGNEAFNQFEKELIEREKKENSSAVQSEQEVAYNETIANIENYTNNLQLRGADNTVTDYSEYHAHDYYDSSNDPNLKMLPDLQPIYETKQTVVEEKPIVSETVENFQEPRTKTKKASRKVKENLENVQESIESDVSAVKEELKKNDKEDTKGIIFLHGKTKQELKYSQQNVNSNTQTIQTTTIPMTAQQQFTKDYNLMPLDEIAPPRNGRSIYEDLPY